MSPPPAQQQPPLRVLVDTSLLGSPDGRNDPVSQLTQPYIPDSEESSEAQSVDLFAATDKPSSTTAETVHNPPRQVRTSTTHPPPIRMRNSNPPPPEIEQSNEPSSTTANNYSPPSTIVNSHPPASTNGNNHSPPSTVANTHPPASTTTSIHPQPSTTTLNSNPPTPVNGFVTHPSPVIAHNGNPPSFVNPHNPTNMSNLQSSSFFNANTHPFPHQYSQATHPPPNNPTLFQPVPATQSRASWVNFSKEETISFLTLMQEHLPIGGNE